MADEHVLIGISRLVYGNTLDRCNDEWKSEDSRFMIHVPNVLIVYNRPHSCPIITVSATVAILLHPSPTLRDFANDELAPLPP